MEGDSLPVRAAVAGLCRPHSTAVLPASQAVPPVTWPFLPLLHAAQQCPKPPPTLSLLRSHRTLSATGSPYLQVSPPRRTHSYPPVKNKQQQTRKDERSDSRLNAPREHVLNNTHRGHN